MNETRESGFLLTARHGGRPPVLRGVEADARLDGVLLTMTLRQRYRNESAANLEVVYTFPLPHDAVLLEFAAELGGQRRKAMVFPRAVADRTYETALAEGDLPALLETAGDGLHTANIGNLKPGEEAVLEIRTAQWLAFDDGRLRIAIPTTIAPRHGDPARAGLQPHQVPVVSVMAHYPLALSLTLGASLADAVVVCPTHATLRDQVDGQTRVSLVPGAAPDRDVVFTVTPPSPRGSMVVTGDDVRAGAGHRVAVAAFEMPRGPDRASIRLRLLVDCSGSMSGDSIALAREAMRSVLAGLTEADEIGLSRFGSDVEHVWAATPCTPAALRRLQRLVDATAASMGGTELERALASLFDATTRPAPGAAAGVAAPAAGPAPTDPEACDVLLITDGEVWDMPDIVRVAAPRGHRIFAIGVGSAPAGSALRQLVDATGGACEFVAPGEDMRDAASRMLRRMRQQPWAGLQLDWGTLTTWRSVVPAHVFGGDTLVAMAGLSAHAGEPRPRLVPKAPCGTQFPVPSRGGSVGGSVGGAAGPGADDTLARLCASRRLRVLPDSEALRLAVDYQLLTEQTHCVLVHSRSQADKALAEAELHRVSTMLAAGWGGMGSATGSAGSLVLSCRDNGPAPSTHGAGVRVLRSPPQPALAAYLERLSLEDAAPRRATLQPARRRASLREVMAAVATWLGSAGSLHDLPRCCLRLNPGPVLLRVLVEARKAGVADAVTWLLLAYWVAQRAGDEGDAAAAAVLRPHATAIAESLRTAAWAVFDRELPGIPSNAQLLPRQERLARSLHPDI